MTQTINLKVNIPQKPQYSYDILIGQNLLADADSFVKTYSKANKFLIVTNETVWNLYKNELNIAGSGLCILKDGEEYKNIDTLKQILDCAVANKLERKDCIIAFGGGVVGDMAGFAAASYMRGIDFLQIPTTLLAQVDSSVGGKVAINHEHGKNLIGAFYQPKLVLVDTSVLKTLDIRQLKTGLAEVLKYAFIEKSCGCENNYDFFEFLNKNINKIYELDPKTIAELMRICCSLKSCIVQKDETEKGFRAILNLGHTYAHAIENLTNYKKYTHGEAVAMGIKMAFNLSLLTGQISEDAGDKALNLIEKYGLDPESTEFCKADFYNEMLLDKKSQDGKVRFVLPTSINSVKIVETITKEEVFKSLV